MAFFYEKKFGGAQAKNIETIFSTMALKPPGAQDVYATMRAAGFGYRKTVMLEDYRHFQAVDRSLTPEAKDRAEKWYENVYKPLFDVHKSAAKVSEALTRIRKGTIQTSEQAAEAADYIENYDSVF